MTLSSKRRAVLTGLWGLKRSLVEEGGWVGERKIEVGEVPLVALLPGCIH